MFALHPAHPAVLSLSRLTLAHFRSYHELRLDCGPSPVVLTGSNGSGKTNVLEAISLLVPGKGLRTAPLGSLQAQHEADPWAVAVELETPEGRMTIGTGRDPEATESDRRLVHIDGKQGRGQTALAEHVAMTWVTPDMDRILAEGPGARRKFIDRLAYSFDPAHSGRVHRYEKALRERLRLLREGRADPAWLTALEDDMAQTGTAIAAARRHLVNQLQDAIDETSGAFPRATLAIKGIAEDGLETQPALLVEDALRAGLAASRSADAESGTCATGPHRSDLTVIHQSKNCPADLCSTGEQKALLIAIILAYVRILARQRRMTPLLLLDDIAAHLDDIRRDALFEEILQLNIQAWLTGTDASAFASLLPRAQHGMVTPGHIEF
jgi:DNA replication and repair protein RecF